MGKLVFYYGVMGCSKTANALITRFQYLEKGKKVLLIKPALDTRDNIDNKSIIASRIGIQAEAYAVRIDESIASLLSRDTYDIIICDEAQFLTTAQVNELRNLSKYIDIICYGLRTDFQSHLFEGSKRLFELADNIYEIEGVCTCGKKAVINARLTADKKIIYHGDQLELGGNDKYVGMCWDCWQRGNI